MSGPTDTGVDLVRLRTGLEAVIELLPIGPEYSKPCSTLFGGLEWADICESLVNDVWNQCARGGHWPEVRDHLERVRQVIQWALHETDLPPEVPPEYAQRFGTRLQFHQAEYSHQVEVDARKSRREARAKP